MVLHRIQKSCEPAFSIIVGSLKMAKKAAMGGTGLINNKWIYDPLMYCLLAALFDEIGVHGSNILQKSEA